MSPKKGATEPSTTDVTVVGDYIKYTKLMKELSSVFSSIVAQHKDSTLGDMSTYQSIALSETVLDRAIERLEVEREKVLGSGGTVEKLRELREPAASV